MHDLLWGEKKKLISSQENQTFRRKTRTHMWMNNCFTDEKFSLVFLSAVVIDMEPQSDKFLSFADLLPNFTPKKRNYFFLSKSECCHYSRHHGNFGVLEFKLILINNYLFLFKYFQLFQIGRTWTKKYERRTPGAGGFYSQFWFPLSNIFVNWKIH